MDGETEDLNNFTQLVTGPQVQCLSLCYNFNIINYTINNIQYI